MMTFLKFFLISIFVFGNTFFKNISNFPIEKRIKILERRIDFICSRGARLPLRETIDEYLKNKKRIDNQSLKVFKKCIFSEDQKVTIPFFAAILDKNDKRYFWHLFHQLSSMPNSLSKKMFRNFLITNIDAGDAYYFSKYKKEIFSIFSEELKVGNKKRIIFQKSIFWGFDSIVKTVLAGSGSDFKSEKNNMFWKCIFLKHQKKFDEALACFEESDIGLSKVFYQLALYAKSKNSVKFSKIKKVVSQIRSSNYPARLKLVNEAIVAVVTGNKKHLDKSVLQDYISSSERSGWYDYILLTLTANSNLLRADQKKLVLSNLEKTQAGSYFVELTNDSVKTKNLSFFQEYSYQSLLLREYK